MNPIAIHEAGHAIVAVRNGVEVVKAVVPLEGNLGGHLEGPIYNPPVVAHQPTADEMDLISKICRYTYAGMYAEMQTFPQGHCHGGKRDLEQINKFADDFFSSKADKDEWKSRMSREAYAEVTSLLPAIKELAGKLAISGEQSAEEIKAILSKHHHVG